MCKFLYNNFITFERYFELPLKLVDTEKFYKYLFVPEVL